MNLTQSSLSQVHFVKSPIYYLCTILDGYSRYIVHWEIRSAMTEADVEVVLQRARERFPQAKPRVISDNGPQFIARDFKHFIGYITPLDKLNQREAEIFEQRRQKLAQAREQRQLFWQQARCLH